MSAYVGWWLGQWDANWLGGTGPRSYTQGGAGGIANGAAAPTTTTIITLAAAPGHIGPNRTTTVTFIGTNTHWLTSTPTFTATGAPTTDGAWSLGPITYVDDTHATRSVTAGATRGVVTWTASDFGRTTTMNVSSGLHRWAPVPMMMRRRM